MTYIKKKCRWPNIGDKMPHQDRGMDHDIDPISSELAQTLFLGFDFSRGTQTKFNYPFSIPP